MGWWISAFTGRYSSGKCVHLHTGNEVELPTEDEAPLSALVFKIVRDPYVGRSGVFQSVFRDDQPGFHGIESEKGRKERIGRLLRMYADRREDIEEIIAGDIGAVLGLKDSLPATRFAVLPIRSCWKISPSRSR